MRRKLNVVAAMCALAGLWGCGGSTPSAPTAVATPTPVPTPTPPVVLLSGAFTVRNGFVVIFRSVTVPTSGVLEITADWTVANNDLDIELVKGPCTGEMYDADTCNFIAFSDSLTAKPEKLRINVTAGTYTPLVDNFGPGDESGAIQVVFTAGASVASSANVEQASAKRSRRLARSIERH